MIDAPFIKKFKVDGKYYIYDVNTNKFFEVDEPVYVLVDEDENKNSDSSKTLKKYPHHAIETAKKNINLMKGKGYFSNNRPEITYFHTIPKDNFLSYIKELVTKKLRRITLNVTDNCNMRCKYCAYSEHYTLYRQHREINMSSETMKKAVDFYFANSPDVEDRVISFYGGEPLYNYKLIKECVEYVKEKYAVPVKYNFTTNATLLDEEKAKFLVENDFSLLVSLDGPKRIHNRYRVFINNKGTFDTVLNNLKNIKSNYPDYFEKNLTFNMVIAPPFDFKAISKFLDKNFINMERVFFNSVNPYFTTFFDCFSSKQLKMSSEKIKNVLASFNRHMAGSKMPNKVERILFNMRYFDIHRREENKLPAKYPSHGQCMIGTKGLFVETEGTLNFCGQVGNFNLGDVFSGIDYKEIERIYFELDEFYSKHCCDCWAIRLCKKCIRDVYKEGKPDEELFESTCKRMKETVFSVIGDYIGIRNRNYHAFDYLNQITINE